MVVVGFAMENITHFNINLDSEIVEICFLCLAFQMLKSKIGVLYHFVYVNYIPLQYSHM